MNEWAKDGACSKTCGGGDQKMILTVKTEAAGTGSCMGGSSKTEKCNTAACPDVVDPGSYGDARKTGSYVADTVDTVDPVDCVMNEWAKDGACSKTCGGGDQKMTRTVKTEAAGGSACDAASKTDSCNTDACPDVVDPCGDNKKSYLSGCSMTDDAKAVVKNAFTCGSHCETKMAAWKTSCADNVDETGFTAALTKAGGGFYCGPPVKPDFDEEAFNLKKATFKVSTFQFKAVAYEAPKDPVVPAETDDFVYVVVEVEKQAVNLPFTFQMTEAEAKSPKMQEALTGGIAKSLGLDLDAVTITHIGGEPVGGARRLVAGDLEITFQIVSDQADTTALEKNIKEAAEEGSIVAAIQEEANSKGVLTQALLDMPLKLTAPTITKSTVTVKVVQMVDKKAITNAPTKSPTKSPTKKPTEAVLSGASATSASRVCLALALCQAIMFVLL